MKYLIDTHVIIWLLMDGKKLSTEVRALIENPKCEIYVSVISLWEIALKFKKGKLKLNGINPIEISDWLDRINIKNIPLNSELALGYSGFDIDHNDPFDNMLVFTAMKEKMVFLTADQKILNTRINGLKTIW